MFLASFSKTRTLNNSNYFFGSLTVRLFESQLYKKKVYYNESGKEGICDKEHDNILNAFEKYRYETTQNCLLVYYKSNVVLFIEDLNETIESYKDFGVNIL